MPSHALLLRLFLSPSFFSVHVALRYLLLYADNIGITYYLTGRLRQFDISELRDVWGFICHLLVTRPSKSRALECFVVEVAQRSTHIAMITFWFMQAALKDISSHGHISPSFAICQRVLHMCHEIIFGDPPLPTTSPYVTLNLPTPSRFARRKVKHNAEPAMVGIGLVLAGAPGMPRLTQIMGEVAIEQGRAEESLNQFRSVESQEDDIARGLSPSQNHQVIVAEPEEEQDDDSSPDIDESQPTIQAPHIEAAPRPGSLARRRTVGAAQTVPALPLHLRSIRRSRASEDPLGQLDTDPIAVPYLSSPSIYSARPAPRSATINRADALLETYDTQSQTQLLRSHYCRSEVQFILSLENICNRLLVIPRPARVSALRAELTALNHKLPAEVCMPMWCSSSDTPKPHGGTQPHHRIVRIPPGESVVLNSAERAPYLLLIEILNDDLDFEPTKRSNKEVLKKIVIKEDERKGTSRDIIPFTNAPTISRHRPKLPSINDSDVVRGANSHPPPPPIAPPVAAVPSDDEEIDLVEQLYGSDQSLRSRVADLSDSIVLPPAPKNKELDMAAWSRTPSIPPTPGTEHTPLSARPLLSVRSSTSRFPNHAPSPSSSHSPSTAASPEVLSLDDYSDRMRTAAIMLAQLNANLVREPTTPNPQAGPSGSQQQYTSPPPPSSSWLPGSRWLGGGFDPPSANGATHSHPSAPDHMQHRMKLQHAEAAAIRDRIMQEMLALEEQRMERMRENRETDGMMRLDVSGSMKSAEDEGIIRRELNKADPSAVVFSESWAAKKSRIRHGSPYGHLATWDCVSVIVKTGGDLRQEQLAVQLIREFQRIWEEEKCSCWVRYFRILITGGTSGLVETITDAVSIHSIKKAEYARRIAEGRFGHVTLLDHFKSTYGDPSSAKFARAQRNFAKSLAGYSVVTYLLQIKDRHNGNILLDRDGHLIHIDFGFILSNTPGNIGFEAAPFKLPPEYIEVLGGVDGAPFLEFRRLFREGFEAARKHCDRIITLVELMQKDSTLPCFAAFGEQTSVQLRERFQPVLTHSLVAGYIDRLIDSSLGSHWTRLYDSYQYYSQSIL
ncbi:Phosphatidylinositol 4-kinase PIK1alpha [Hypsizygus marmoreus]|uniref:1-phosphatidylinositol 4-kinase n=1 Tax=Hypsizygus marmoreus TaxID=39966 RepID=A0A369JIL9_HYPMA|nr:Phosphatidylinositol 4-kinase PIK1alpha [Hypsizygus marmoreus]